MKARYFVIAIFAFCFSFILNTYASENADSDKRYSITNKYELNIEASKLIKYDYDKAKNLQGQVKNVAQDIKNTLKNFKTKNIDQTSSWWTGPDQQAFVKKFMETNTQIEKVFNEFVSFYDKLIGNISQSKQDHTNKIAKSM